MKILFLQHNGKPYGANKSLLTLMQHLKGNNEVLVIAPFRNCLHSEITLSDIQSITLPLFPSVFFIRRRTKYLLYPLLMLLNIIIFPLFLFYAIKFKPDIIYSNSSVENLGLIISKILRVKHVCHVREFGDKDYDFFCVFGKLFKKWYLNMSNGIIFNSKIIQRTVLPIKDQKTNCETIYNGIEIDNLHVDEKRWDGKRKFRLGIVGYIHSEKKQLKALEFLKDELLNKRDIELYIYGNGDRAYLRKINDFIACNSLEKYVYLKGFNADVSKIYNSFDVLIVFAENEAFGRVTIEAMKFGIPVIAYNGGGTSELIESNVDGYLFENKLEFIYQLELLKNNPELYNKISNNAIKKVREKFNKSLYVEKIERFLHGI